MRKTLLAAALLASLSACQKHEAPVAAPGADAAATTTVAAIRAAARNEFLAPERGHAVAAVAGDDINEGFINEFHGPTFS